MGSNFTEGTIAAIPTVYRGIQLKSRLEAQCALLLDKMNWGWEYEPFSVMLDGVNFMPDFYVRDLQLVVETRGYKSNKGKRQIEKFSSFVNTGETIPGFPINQFATIGPEVSLLRSPAGNLSFCVCLCHSCAKWLPMEPGKYQCACGSSAILNSFQVAISEGKLSVNGNQSEEWDSLCWSRCDHARVTSVKLINKCKRLIYTGMEDGSDRVQKLSRDLVSILDTLTFNEETLLLEGKLYKTAALILDSALITCGCNPAKVWSGGRVV